MRGAAGAGARSDLAISNCARPDHEQDAGGAEICCRPDRRPGMTQDLAGAAPARGRSPAVDRVGSSKITFSTPARAVRSPFRLTCLRTAPTGGEEGGEPAGAVCRGRRALVVCVRSPRAGGRQVTEASGERARSTLASVLCATLKSPSQTRKTGDVLVDNKPCSGRHQRAGRRRSCCASKSRRPSSRIVSSSCALTDGSARLLAGSAITVDGRQEDQRCAARRQTTTLAPARRGFLAARQMVSGRRWRHGRDELRGRHVAMRPSY